MANKRMFSKDVVLPDEFVEMPTSAKLLYYDLGMRADDDGFVGSPRQVMKISRASEDDMKLLISKKFVIPFESGVIVITHWFVNNYIRKDRYKETIYLKEKDTLYLDKIDCYTQNPEEAVSLPYSRSNPQPHPTKKKLLPESAKPDIEEKWLPQEKVGEDRIGKVSIEREEAPSQNGISLYGKFKNIYLSDEQYKDLIRTYKDANTLIEKVSCIFENKSSIPSNPFAYIHKIGIEDGFERLQPLKDEKKRQREIQRQQVQEQQLQQEQEEWYQEKMKEYGACSKEEVHAIARQNLEEWKKNFGKN